MSWGVFRQYYIPPRHPQRNLVATQTAPEASIAQQAFRFYNDDGTESTNTAIAAQNTNINYGLTDTFFLRMRLAETGGTSGASTDDYNLQYRKNGGTWAAVNLIGSNVRIAASTLTDGEATTERLTGGSGTFLTGRVEEAGVSDLTNFQITANNYTEFLYALKLQTADLVDADVLEFRYTRNGTAVTQTVTPSVTYQAAITLLPDLFTNTNSFFTATETLNLDPNLYSNVNTFYSPTQTFVLAPSLWSNTSTFYDPSVGFVVLPDLFTNTNTFYSPTESLTLFPDLFTNSQTFYTHVIGTGTILSPDLFTNTNSFYSPTITMDVAPSLFTNTNTFYSPTQSFILAPSLLTNSQTFYGPTQSFGLTPSLFTNTNAFYSPSINRTIFPGLFTNTSSFYSPTQSFVLSPSLYSNSQSFFSPTLGMILSPSLLTNTNSFFSPTEGLTIFPGLYSNNQTFYSPSIVIPQTINPGLFVNVNEFFQHAIHDPFRDRIGRALGQPLLPLGHRMRTRFGRR